MNRLQCLKEMLDEMRRQVLVLQARVEMLEAKLKTKGEEPWTAESKKDWTK